MNSCILMAKIVRRPELRYTQDNQTPYTQMLVEFDASRRENEPPATLKVVAWRNLATEVSESYDEGDKVIIEGRLSMQTIERPEGFKEKRAELVVSQIYPLKDTEIASTPATKSTVNDEKVVPINSFKHKQSEPEPLEEEVEEPSYESPRPSLQTVPAVADEQNLDDIPF